MATRRSSRLVRSGKSSASGTTETTSPNAGRRPAKQARLEVDSGPELEDVEVPQTRLRGNRGLLSWLTEFPFDVLLEVRFDFRLHSAQDVGPTDTTIIM
jgi:hypothetical protein